MQGQPDASHGNQTGREPPPRGGLRPHPILLRECLACHEAGGQLKHAHESCIGEPKIFPPSDASKGEIERRNHRHGDKSIHHWCPLSIDSTHAPIVPQNAPKTDACPRRRWAKPVNPFTSFSTSTRWFLMCKSSSTTYCSNWEVGW